jgi:hypothetical protein
VALEELNTEMLVDTAFSLHVDNQLAPVYISEVVPTTINPEFREMDLTMSRWRNARELSLQVWGWVDGQWLKIFHTSIDLRSLVFVGKTADTITASFPHNTVIIYLTDGCYVLPRVASRAGIDSDTGLSSRDEAYSTISASYDAMMKISNLNECIHDAVKTRDRISKDISTRLKGGGDGDTSLDPQVSASNGWQRSTSNEAYMVAVRQRAELNGVLSRIESGLAAETRQTGLINKQISDARARLESRRSRVAEARERNDAILAPAHSGTSQSESRRLELDEVLDDIKKLTGTAALQLLEIFSIEPAEHRTLEFTINGLPLIEPTTGPHDEDVLGAAYGLTTQLVDILSRVLGVPLRYPVQPYGSQSFVIDPISDIEGSRAFPLWSKGSLFYRFEYGVFLLQKDVEQLLNSQGLRVVDLKLMLANLKNLLLVLGTRKDQ